MAVRMTKAACAAELELCRQIIDSIHNGVIVTDADGYVIFFNRPYGRFLGVEPAAQIGRHATEVIENTRMHIVARTGIAEFNKTHRVGNQDMVVQRIPIKQNGRVIAVFGQVMFKDVGDLRQLAERLSLLESKVKLYEQELLSLRSTRYTFDSIIAASSLMVKLKQDALRAAATALPVLITGESGTGKEMFAQAIHHASNRRVHPFIRINCASIPKDLLEAELFGYAQGAFTGARNTGKPGKFELANQGSIFLDEIGDLPLDMQPKLLRVLEEKEFERVGGVAPVCSDFRLIAATNHSLLEQVEKGFFRADLYYRLKGIPLSVPPLRERAEDIPLLLESLLGKMLKELYRPDLHFSPEALQALCAYHWPGNVREMSNVLGQILATVDDERVEYGDLPLYLQTTPTLERSGSLTPLAEMMATAEKRILRQALTEAGGNKSLAARRLGIHRTLLYKKLKKTGLA